MHDVWTHRVEQTLGLSWKTVSTSFWSSKRTKLALNNWEYEILGWETCEIVAKLTQLGWTTMMEEAMQPEIRVFGIFISFTSKIHVTICLLFTLHNIARQILNAELDCIFAVSDNEKRTPVPDRLSKDFLSSLRRTSSNVSRKLKPFLSEQIYILWMCQVRETSKLNWGTHQDSNDLDSYEKHNYVKHGHERLRWKPPPPRKRSFGRLISMFERMQTNFYRTCHSSCPWCRVFAEYM